MQSEKPSFARFGGNHNMAGGGNGSGMPRPIPMTAEKPVSVLGDGGVPVSRAEVPRSRAEGTSSGGSKVSKTALLLDAVITVSLVALFFGVPLFFTGLTFQGIAFEKQIYFYLWLLIGIVAWASKGVVTGEMRIRRTPLDIPLLAFWVVYTLSAFFSVDRWHSVWGFFGDPSRGVIAVTALILAYYFLLSHFTVRRFYWLFWAFLSSGFIVVAWSFLVVMKIRFLPLVWERFAPMSLIGTVSTLGIFLSLLVPLFLTGLFMLWKENKLQKSLRMTVTAGIFIGLALTLFLLLALYPYVSWVVVLGGLSFFLVYILAQIVRPAEQWVWVPMVIFVVVLAFLMIGRTNLTRATLPVEVAPNTSLSWQVAQDAVKEHFFTGVGPANYGYAFSMFHPLEYNENTLYTLRFYQGNGMFFEVLPTVGALGAVLFVIVWLSFLSVGLYLLTYEKERNKVYSLGLWTAVAMFFLASFMSVINGPLLIIGTLLSTLALGILFFESGSEERYLYLSFKAAPKFALALAFIFMVVSAGVAFLFVFVGKVFIADVYAGRAVSVSSAGPNRDAANFLLRAIGAYPQEGRYATRLAQEYMALGNTEAGKAEAERDINAVTFYVREAIAAGERGKKLMPNDVMATETLGLIYENASLYASDALPRAEASYARALELEPKNPLYTLKLGQIKKLTGDGKKEGEEQTGFYREAEELFLQSIEQKKDLAIAHYNLSAVRSRLKNTDQAIESAMEAFRIENTNLNYAYNLGVMYQVRDTNGDHERAEALFKDILSKNEKLIDVRLSLGLLYEADDKREAAIAEYEKLLQFLPDDQSPDISKTADQVRVFIENVRNGTGNLAKKNVTEVPPAPVSPEPEAVPAALPPAPALPNESPLTNPGQ